MIELPHGNPEKDPGVWKGARRSDGVRTATVSCPTCGKPAPLSEHSIAPGGTVSPSLVCPYEGCDFHDHVRLIGWNPNPASPS